MNTLQAMRFWLGAAGLIGLLFSPFLPCALIGLTLAVALFPVHRFLGAWLERRFAGRLSAGRARVLAAVITEAGAVAAMVLGLLLPATVLYHNRRFIADKGFALYRNTQEWAKSEKQELGRRLNAPGWIDLEGAEAPPGGPEGPEALSNLKQLVDNLPPLGQLALRMASQMLLWLVRLMVLLLIVHVSLLYGPDLWGHILGHSPEHWRQTLLKLGQHGRDALRAVYVTHGLTALAAFVIAVPVFALILGRPYFFLAAVLAGLFQFVPLLGSATLVAAMTLYFFAAGQQDRGWLCLLVALPLVVGVPDLVIRPALARSQGRISGFTMLIGFMTGFEAFGPAGFVLGPLCLELFVCFTAIMLYGPDWKNVPFTRRRGDEINPQPQ